MFSLKNKVLSKRILVIEILLVIELVKSENITSKCIYKKSNTAGVCITIQNCKEALSYLEKGESFQYCGIDNGIPKVCCSKYGGETSVAEEKCKDYSQIYDEIPGKIEYLKSRISGGATAKFGEFPHMAVLGYGNHPSVSWDCGGSLISEKFVLTAAHCISGTSRKNLTMVQLGDIEIDSAYSKIYSVRKVFKYPDYSITTQYHDIGLVELNTSVVFLANIIPACLPNPKTNIFPNSLVSGFGATDAYGTMSQILQWTNVHYFPINECFTRFKKSLLLPNGVLDEIQLCYGSRISGRDACEGDSGGPLQNYDSDLSLYRVIGVVSTGKPCGSANTPGIYTKVSFYIPWIESIAWKSEFMEAFTATEQQVHHRVSLTKEDVVRRRVAKEKCDEFSKLIIDDENATGSEFPHMVAIGFGDDENLWWCDGTLISEKFVLTSAWCTIRPKFVEFREISLSDPSPTRKVINIAKIYRHPNYQNPLLHNDIALIELELPVTFSSHIKPACLHTETDNDLFPKLKTVVTGWAMIEANGNSSKKIGIKEIEYQYLNNCQSYFESYKNVTYGLPNGINLTSQLCFGSRDKGIDTCYYFYGAPLQFYDLTTNQYRVIGIHTDWEECGNGNPHLFTKVAAYIDWIEEIVWKESFSDNNTNTRN